MCVAVQLLSHVQLFATPWTATCQASLSPTISQSLPNFISIELLRCIGEPYYTRDVPVNSTSFLRYISILTPKLLSFPSQRRNRIPRLLKEVTATQEQDPFPAVSCLFPSVDVSGNYWEPWDIFIPKHDLLHSEVKKCNDISFPTAMEQPVFGMYCYYLHLRWHGISILGAWKTSL